MFPLQKRTLIRGAAAHVTAGLGIGADYVAEYAPFVIPFTGRVETYFGPEGGNWLRLTRSNGDKIELAHLSKYEVKPGNATEGQIGGVTGNTGSITAGPHLHIQIINRASKRLDPETYDWGKESMNQTRYVLGKDGKTVFKATPIATDFENLKKQASVEGITVPNPIPPASTL